VIRRVSALALPAAIVAGLAFLPRVSTDIPKLFNGPINSPGTLQLLAICLVFGGLALTYDLLFGFTGLLSFGHALYFAVGVYLPAIAMTRWHWNFAPSLLLTAGFALVLPLVVGFISLRVTGIAFAMVTLAFAQIGAIYAIKNPKGWTGGEEGFSTDYRKLPDFFVGVFNTKYLYWLALGYAVVVFVIVRWAVSSSPGRVWQAIRENELRVEVLGLRPHGYKLMAFVLSSFLATAGGTVYVLLQQGPSPEVTSPNITLALLIMVVLGGPGTRWGAILGGILYKYAENRLGAIGDSSTVHDLPGVLRTPLSEPLVMLGVLFILVVFFLPGGIARLTLRGRARRAGLARLEQAVTTPSAPVGGIEEAT
jgi:branched-chain amino acid transport system permease protein